MTVKGFFKRALAITGIVIGVAAFVAGIVLTAGAAAAAVGTGLMIGAAAGPGVSVMLGGVITATASIIGLGVTKQNERKAAMKKRIDDATNQFKAMQAPSSKVIAQKVGMVATKKVRFAPEAIALKEKRSQDKSARVGFGLFGKSVKAKRRRRSRRIAPRVALAR